jgi:hypothetical protein
MPFWRYEIIVEKTIQWIETLKNRKKTSLEGNSKTEYELDINKNPDSWMIN